MLKNEGWEVVFPLGMGRCGALGLSFERCWGDSVIHTPVFGRLDTLVPGLMRKELAYRPGSAFGRGCKRPL